MVKSSKLLKICLLMVICLTCFALAFGCGNKTDDPEDKLSEYISLNYYEIELTEEQSKQLIVTTDLSGEKVWSVSDATIASVENGTITALKAGECTVRVSIGEEYAECKVKVFGKLTGLPSLVLDMSSSTIYKDFTLKVTPILRVGADYVQESVQYQWSTSDSAVVTVSDSGVVCGVNSGTATITATCTYNGQQLSAETVVTVKQIVVFNILKDTYNLALGNNNYKNAEILYELSGTSSAVQFESQNENVVTVNSNGIVTAVGIGSTEVKMSCEGRLKTVKVTVYDKLISTKQDFILLIITLTQ